MYVELNRLINREYSGTSRITQRAAGTDEPCCSAARILLLFVLFENEYRSMHTTITGKLKLIVLRVHFCHASNIIQANKVFTALGLGYQKSALWSFLGIKLKI